MKNTNPGLTANDFSELFDAFNRHDIKGVMQYFAEDSVFYTVGGPDVFGKKFEGLEDISKAFQGVWQAMPDARWDHHSHFVHDNVRAVSEWTFTGTYGDGTRIEAQGADLFTLRDGKIVVKQAFRKDRPLQKS